MAQDTFIGYRTLYLQYRLLLFHPVCSTMPTFVFTKNDLRFARRTGQTWARWRREAVHDPAVGAADIIDLPDVVTCFLGAPLRSGSPRGNTWAPVTPPKRGVWCWARELGTAGSWTRAAPLLPSERATSTNSDYASTTVDDASIVYISDDDKEMIERRVRRMNERIISNMLVLAKGGRIA